MLHRIRGFALAQLGDVDDARTELDVSLEVARARNARYEVALALDGVARISEHAGQGDAAARAEADELFRTLGVIQIARVPLDSTLAARR
jgi:hypothetical protein